MLSPPTPRLFRIPPVLPTLPPLNKPGRHRFHDYRHLRQPQAPPQPVEGVLSLARRRANARFNIKPAASRRSPQKLPPQPLLSPARQPTPLLSQAPRRPPRPQVLSMLGSAETAWEKWYVTSPEVSITSSPSCTSQSLSDELYDITEDTTADVGILPAVAKPDYLKRQPDEYPGPDEVDYTGFIITYDTATSINIVSSPKFSPVKLGPGFDSTVLSDSPGWSVPVAEPKEPAHAKGSEDSSLSLILSSGLMKLAGMFFAAHSDNTVSTSHSRSIREALARDAEKDGWLKASRQHLLSPVLSPVVDFCQRTWTNIFDTLRL